tara:strand:- start:14 stop:484 length:471 start_codon:yes stop_codon:yes gene_type:complete
MYDSNIPISLDTLSTSEEKYSKLINIIQKNNSKNSDNVTKKYLSSVTPVLISFIGAFGLLIECFVNILIKIINDSEMAASFLKKVFNVNITFQEMRYSSVNYLSNFIDQQSQDCINSSIKDLVFKLSNSYNNLNKCILTSVENDIDKKLEEFSEVD